MKIQTLLVAGLLLVPCFASQAKVVVAADEPVIAEGCECLAMPTPMLEKISSQCSIEEKAPAACVKVEKVQKTTDVYRIPSHCKRCCTITDENGTRPCGCGESTCCPKKCDKCTRPHCNRCSK